jgi:outer membrane protein OmpA-like peptidoglycan-associated protein
VYIFFQFNRNNCWLVALFLCTICPSLFSQEVTIINQYQGVPGTPPDQFVLSQITQHTYIINSYEPVRSGPRAQVEDMIRYGLRSYIDNQYYINRGRVEALEGGDKFNPTAAGIVRNALWIHDQDFHQEFKTFSKAVTARADELKKLHGARIDSSPEGGSATKGNGSVNLFAFQRMVYNLKIEAEKEVAEWLNKKMGSVSLAEQVDQKRKEASKPLEGFEYQLPRSDSNIENLLALRPVPPRTLKADRKSRRNGNAGDNGLSERVVKLLEDNNKILAAFGDRFGDLQAQINELRSDRNLTAAILREEMAALRELVQAIATTGTRPAEQGARPAPELALYFEKGETQLTAGHRSQLSALELSLKLDGMLVASITGFADRTGNSIVNQRIAEQRAQAVATYFSSRGIPMERIVINSLGDTESRFPNPADRRVEVKVFRAGGR